MIAFKIPSYEVEKHPERLFTHWCAPPFARPCCAAVLALLCGLLGGPCSAWRFHCKLALV